MRYQAAIFDLDGTLLDTLGDLTESLGFALCSCGMPARTQREVRAFVGNGIPRLVELAVPAGTDAQRQAQVLAAMTEHYAAHCADRTQPYPGTVDTLRRLRDAGVRVAVVSNKADYAVQTLCAQYFPGLLDCAVGLRDGVRKKPWPDAVLAALDRFDIAPQDAVYIGDSEVDVATAQRAGTALIAVDWGFRTRGQLIAAGAGPVIVSDAEALQRALGLAGTEAG